ncbi:hypothetical protein V8F20_011630 [Naviculisporaceae sp. PSN 640]
MTMKIEISDEDDHDGGTTYNLWLEMHAPRTSNAEKPDKPLSGINDEPSPWAVFVLVRFDAVNLARIMQKDGLFCKHPAEHIVPADLKGNNTTVMNKGVVGGRRFNHLELRGSAKIDKDFKWDTELIHSWRIREFPEKPATRSRWSGRILLCVRDRGELARFPGLGVLKKELLVRWFVCNSWGIFVLHSVPSKMKCPDMEDWNYNHMDQRSVVESLLWIWPGTGRIKTSDITFVGGGVLTRSEGTRSPGGGRSDVRPAYTGKPPAPVSWREVLVTIVTSQNLEKPLHGGILILSFGVAWAIFLQALAALIAACPPTTTQVQLAQLQLEAASLRECTCI